MDNFSITDRWVQSGAFYVYFLSSLSYFLCSKTNIGFIKYFKRFVVCSPHTVQFKLS